MGISAQRGARSSARNPAQRHAHHERTIRAEAGVPMPEAPAGQSACNAGHLGYRDINLSQRSQIVAKELLIRDIPDEIREWIAEVSVRRCQTRKEVVLNVLRQAHAGSAQLSLFEPPPRTITMGPGAIPFSFVDLFGGIGGMRLGLEPAGGRCLFSCEWDRFCQKTYSAWFGETPAGDITKLKATDIPDHDVLAAGFPCQPFSIAGVSKKNSLGRANGFRDVAQWAMFSRPTPLTYEVDCANTSHPGCVPVP